MNEVRHKVRTMQQFSIPKLTLDHRGRYYVSFFNGKRHRFANGRALDIALDPNRLDPSIRQEAAEELCYLIHGKLREGWGTEINKDEIRALNAVRSFTVDPAFTKMYTKALQLTQQRFIDFLQRKGLQALKLSDVKDSHLRSFLVSLDLSVSSYNHELKHIASILSKLMPSWIVQPCRADQEEERDASASQAFRRCPSCPCRDPRVQRESMVVLLAHLRLLASSPPRNPSADVGTSPKT